MTKANIIIGICGKAGFSKQDSANFAEATFGVIKGCLGKGENVKISGFGNFVVHTKRSHKGINPQTGEAILIMSVKF